MKKIITTILVLMMVLQLMGQSNYTEAIAQGDKALKEGNYKTAINKYFAAEAFDPTKKDEVKIKVNAAFDKIMQLKDEAETAKKNAEEQKLIAQKLVAQSDTLIRSFLPKDTKNIYAYFRRQADSLKNVGDYTLAIQKYNLADNASDKPKAVNLTEKIEYAKKYSLLKQKADNLFAQQKYEDALPIYEQIVADNKKDSLNKNKLSTIDPTFDLVFVPGGSFMMGDNTGESDEKPEHKVTLSSFEITRYEITNQQYAKFVNEYGSDKVKDGEYKGETMIYEYPYPGWGLIKEKQNNKEIWKSVEGKENHPVVYVTWYGANEFCKYYGGALPTEAQWEYAASFVKKPCEVLKTSQGLNNSQDLKNKWAGTNNEDSLQYYAWYNGSYTHTVGQKLPNQLGIYDLSGNVWEWCNDWYGTYEEGEVVNPQGLAKSSVRVLRGGGYYIIASNCYTAYRYYYNPNYDNSNYGFRFVFGL